MAVSITQHTGQWSVFSPRSAQECDLITGLGSALAGTNQATMETMNLTGQAASAALATAPPDNTFYLQSTQPPSYQASQLTARFSNVGIQSPRGLRSILRKYGLI